MASLSFSCLALPQCASMLREKQRVCSGNCSTSGSSGGAAGGRRCGGSARFAFGGGAASSSSSSVARRDWRPAMTLGGGRSFDTFRDNGAGVAPNRFQRSGYLLGQPLKSLDPCLHLGPELPRLQRKSHSTFKRDDEEGGDQGGQAAQGRQGRWHRPDRRLLRLLVGAQHHLQRLQQEGAQRLPVSVAHLRHGALRRDRHHARLVDDGMHPSSRHGHAVLAESLPFEAFQVAVAHSIGHVAATISMARSAVAFTQIIKSAEPAFSVVLSRLFLGERYPLPVYLSLLPVVGGCCLSAVTELNFDMIGFLGANVSNVAFVFRNFFSKRGMSKKVSGLNYYGCLCIMSLAILTPFAIAIEGFHTWNVGWQTASRAIGPPFLWWVVAQSVFYHLYNQVSYMSLDQISPLTFSIGNTMKRVSVIAASIFIFKTPVQPVNLIGAAIAIFGTFLYSQVDKSFLGVNSLTVLHLFCKTSQGSTRCCDSQTSRSFLFDTQAVIAFASVSCN